jgi:TrmH family RNA methyltransferase
MSISKAQIKEIRSLHLQKFRQIYNKFLAEGLKNSLEFIRTRKYRIEHIYLTETAVSALLPEIEKYSLAYTVVLKQHMEQITALSTPSEVLLVLERTEDELTSILKSPSGILYLDGVQDPGNVGTMIRIADWFGISSVLRSPDSADFFNPKVVQATMGSMNKVQLRTALLDELPLTGKSLFGTFMDGTTYQSVNIPPDAILVFGSEGRGISPEVEALIQHRITIPGQPGRVADSLNVSISAGILAAHWKGASR